MNDKLYINVEKAPSLVIGTPEPKPKELRKSMIRLYIKVK